MQDLTLTIVRGEPAGAEFVVPQGEEHLIGRESPAVILIPEDPFVSTRHAVIAWAGDGFEVKDLSVHGTRVNNRAVKDARLFDGDELRVGDTAFRVGLVTRAEGADAGEASDQGPPPPEVADGLEQTTGYRSPSAEQLAARFNLAEEHASVATHAVGDATPEQVVNLLRENGELETAVSFLAYSLPKRAAAAWAAACCREAFGENLAEADAGHLERVDAWVAEPTEKNRRAVLDAAEASELDTVPSWVAMAAAMSGGSIAPHGGPEVLPDDALSGKTVAGAVNCCAVVVTPENAETHRARYIDLGLAAARGEAGEQLWANE